MSDFGLQVFSPSGKALNVSDAAPLQFIRKITDSEVDLGSSGSTTFDFSSQVPAGVQLMVWTDIAALVLDSPTYLTYNTVPINITVNDRKVTISVPSFGAGAWGAPPERRPSGYWVFAVYQQPVTADGWGLYVDEGGAFPAVVNSSASLFMTGAYTITFTGTYQLNCSANAMVFCNCSDDSVGLIFDQASKQIKGYKPAGADWGTQGGFSVTLKICVFDIKTPTVPDWGLMIYGADGQVSFTSSELPLIIRQQIPLPSAVGNWSNFSSPGNIPMIPLSGMGSKTTRQSDIWRVNPALNSTHVGYGPGARLVHVGDNILPDLEVIPLKGKTIPVIWGSDYF
ncbi:DUF6453 family protein [Scandinavium sp.]|uniref:DUF6453 family protein n=1 Tax=Scandinavium sp. TaxID=2830653 RepID=UPI00289C1F75|nr:DUF6453 family protein [Scandinavium sp.]